MTDQDLDSIKSEIAYKIYNSSVNRYPFAHSETENILPNRILEEILENWPQSDEFKTNLESGSVVRVDQSDKEHPYNFRYQINLTDSKEINQIKNERIEFWKNFAEILGSGEVILALINLYANTLMRRFKLDNLSNLLTDIKYVPRLHLLHDKTNYSLGPHTDNPDKVIVVLIYFESDKEDNTQSSFGTSVYIPKKKRVRLFYRRTS